MRKTMHEIADIPLPSVERAQRIAQILYDEYLLCLGSYNYNLAGPLEDALRVLVEYEKQHIEPHNDGGLAPLG